jgi:hypothetical protein
VLKQLFTDPKTVIPAAYDHGGAADQVGLFMDNDYPSDTN